MSEIVECPKCGFTQPEGPECISCGIVYAKYWAAQQAAGHVPANPPMPVTPTQPEQPAAPPLVAEPAPAPVARQPAPPVSPAVPPVASASGDGYEDLLAEGGPSPGQLLNQHTASPGHNPAGSGPAQAAPQPQSFEAAAQVHQAGYQLAGAEPAAAAPPQPAPAANPVLGPGGAPMAGYPQGAPGSPPTGEHRPAVPQRPHRGFTRDTRAEVPIGTSPMVIRALAGVACLAIAVLMFANGKGLLSVWPYVIMVFYAGAALWGLSSFRQKITVQQFAVEMAVLVAITLALRVAAPEMFAVETQSKGTPKVVQPHLPRTQLGTFTKRVLSYVEAGRTIVSSHEAIPKETWDKLVQDADFEAIQAKYKMLSIDEAAHAMDTWKRLKEVGPMLAEMLASHGKEGPDGVVFSPPSGTRTSVKSELDQALQRAGQLRARLLVYPELDDEM